MTVYHKSMLRPGSAGESRETELKAHSPRPMAMNKMKEDDKKMKCTEDAAVMTAQYDAGQRETRENKKFERSFRFNI